MKFTLRPLGAATLSALALGLLVTDADAQTSTPPADVSWSYIGPAAYGACWGLAFHPSDPQTIMAGLDMGAAFITRDGGKSWAIVGAMGRLPPAQPAYRGGWGIAFDPRRPDIIWIASEHGASKSSDGGRSWTMLFGGTPTCYDAIAIDPTDPDIVYIGEGRSVRLGVSWTTGYIHKTIDGGKTWDVQRPGGPLNQDTVKARNWSRIVIDPTSAFVKGQGHQRLYAVGQGGFYVSGDAGRTWISLEAAMPGGSVDLARGNEFGDHPTYTSGICDLVLIPAKDHAVIFATFQVRPTKDGWLGGVYRSDDDGQTWVQKNKGLEPTLAYMATDSFHRDQGLAFGYSMIAATPADPKLLYFGCHGAVFKSTDQGESWTCATQSNEEWVKVSAPDGQSMYMHVRKAGGNYLNASWGGIAAFNGLAISASAPQVAAYTDNNGVCLTVDGGRTWDEVMFQFGQSFRTLPPLKDKDGREIVFAPQRLTHRTQAKGIQLVVPESVAIDPFDPKTMAVGYDDIGLEISRNGGEDWEWSCNGIYLNAEQNNVTSVVYDPTVKGRMFVGTSRSGAGKLYRSDDGGRSFQVIGIEPLLKAGKGHVNEILIDPASDADARTLYVATTEGLFKTTDGAKSWTELQRSTEPGKDKAPFGNVGHLAMDPTHTGILWVGTHPYAGQPVRGLFKSLDGGRTWTQLAPDKLGGIRSISLCRARPDVVVVVANVPGSSGTWAMAKAWKTTDGGASWQLLDDQRASCAAVHPLHPEILYVGHWAQDVMKEKVGLYRSSDGGKTWREAHNGIAFTLGFTSNDRILFDPGDPRRLFLLASNGLLRGMDNEPVPAGDAATTDARH